MAHVAPTIHDFRARYGSEFACVSDTTIQAVMADASVQVSLLWAEADYPRAIMLLTAHTLLTEGLVEFAAGKKSMATTAGVIQSKKVGDVQVTYAGVGGAFLPNGYGATVYGRRFYDLMRANFPAVAIV